MADLLLELFSEEIPARMQAKAGADLGRLMTAALKEAGFSGFEAKSFAGPRRLTYVATGLPERQKDTREERKGPRVGAPDKALEGFLRGAGLSDIGQAEQREDKKGAFYVAIIEREGRDTAAVVAEAVPAIARSFPWPKSMRWGGPDAKLSWVRPLRRVLCTLGGVVVPFTIENGDRPITSGDLTEGHRFMGPKAERGHPFAAATWDAYDEGLRRAHVVLDADERKTRVLADAKALCQAQGLELVKDEGLLAEVAGLAEWPVARIGTFDEAFLGLPDEVLTASMKGHQKYFSVRNPKTGRLAPRFVTVANVDPEDGGAAMMEGYERVLTARLSDGLFLFEQDKKTKLEDHAKKLSGVVFFEGLGTIADKVDRVATLAREIAPKVGADPALAEKAARLAKADLVTEMVGEFPELQGVMGRYYAQIEGLDTQVADAIRDHYKPAGQGDEVPTAPVSVAVALADKLATLAMFWSIEKTPTGSSDPFALRRMALGVIQIILANSLHLHIGKKIASWWNSEYGPIVRQLIEYNDYTDLENWDVVGRAFVLHTVAERLPLVTQYPNVCTAEDGRILKAVSGYYDGMTDSMRAAIERRQSDGDLIEPLQSYAKFNSDGDGEFEERTVDVIVEEFNNIPNKIRRNFWLEKQEIINAIRSYSSCVEEVLKPEDGDPLVVSNKPAINGLSSPGVEYGTDEADRLDEMLPKNADDVIQSLISFFNDRLTQYLRDQGHRHDRIAAALRPNEDDLARAVSLFNALNAFLDTPEGANLTAAYKRATNILRAEAKKGDLPTGDVDPALLADPAERALHEKHSSVLSQTGTCLADEDFEGAMSALSSLRAPLDDFFEEVKVNADDPAVRANRLKLLGKIKAVCELVADLGKLEG